jgi:hypothetical protein
MTIYTATIEATGIVTVDDPKDPASSVERYLMDEAQARDFSLEKLRDGTLPRYVLGVVEGHVGADTDDVDGDEAKVFVSITVLVDAESEDAAYDLEDEEGVPQFLKEIASRMGVDFDLDSFETLETGTFEMPVEYGTEMRSLIEKRIADDSEVAAPAPCI